MRLFVCSNAKHGAGLVTYLHLFEKDMEALCTELNEGYKVFLSVPGGCRSYQNFYVLEISLSCNFTTRRLIGDVTSRFERSRVRESRIYGESQNGDYSRRTAGI